MDKNFVHMYTDLLQVKHAMAGIIEELEEQLKQNNSDEQH